MTAVTATVPVTVSGAPAWFVALPDRVWTRVARGTGAGFDSGATVQQRQPSPLPSGIYPTPYVFSYSGACVDQTRGAMLVFGGGHGDYAGNEVYELILRAPTPAWTRLIDPSPGSFSAGTQTEGGTGQYALDRGLNGAPASNHSSSDLVFANGKMWLPKVWGMFPNATGTPRIFWFDREELRWKAGTYWKTAAQIAQGGGLYESQPAFYIPLENAIYTGANHFVSPPVPILVKIDATTGTVLKSWTDMEVYPGLYPGKPVVIPSTRLVVLVHSYAASFQVWDFSVDPPTLTNSPVTDSTGVSGWTGETHGVAFHAASNAIIAYTGGGEDLVALTVPSNPKVGPWVARKVSPANVSDPARIIPPTHSYVYGRFNLVNDMGDGRSALVYFPSDPTAAVYVMALPATGV